MTKTNPFVQRSFLFVLFLIWASQVQAQFKVGNFEDDSEHSYQSSDTFSSFEIKYRGTITLSDDEQSIASISPDGYLKIKTTTFGNKRAVILNGQEGGRFSREYYVGRKQTEFDPDGKKWLADIMPEVLERTSVGAKQRIEKRYQQGGMSKVLKMIGSLKSNYVKSVYYSLILDGRGLSKNEKIAVAKSIGEEVGSSSRKGELYTKFSSVFLEEKDEAIMNAYFDGVAKISSSSEKGRILRKILKEEANLSDKSKVALLRTTRSISSSSEKGSILRSYNNIFSNSNEVIEAYFETLDAISSSSEKGSTLRSLIDKKDLSASATRTLFKSVGKISSSSEKGSILRMVIPDLSANAVMLDEFFLTVDRISSTTERGSILRKILKEESLHSSMSERLFQSVTRIESSTEKGSVLRMSVPVVKQNPQLAPYFFDAVQSLSSTTEKGSVLRTVASQYDKMPKDILLNYLETAKYISSSTEKGSVIRKVAPLVKEGDEETRKAYLSAARSISSDSEYRSVMESIN